MQLFIIQEMLLFNTLETQKYVFSELDVTVTSPLGGELPLDIKRISKEKEVDLVSGNMLQLSTRKLETRLIF